MKKVFKVFLLTKSIKETYDIIVSEYGPVLSYQNMANVLKRKTYTGYIYIKNKIGNEENEEYIQASFVPHEKIIEVVDYEKAKLILTQLKDERQAKKKDSKHFLEDKIFCLKCYYDLKHKEDKFYCQACNIEFTQQGVEENFISWLMSTPFVQGEAERVEVNSDIEKLMIKKRKLESDYATCKMNIVKFEDGIAEINMKIKEVNELQLDKKYMKKNEDIKYIIRNKIWKELRFFLTINSIEVFIDENYLIKKI